MMYSVIAVLMSVVTIMLCGDLFIANEKLWLYLVISIIVIVLLGIFLIYLRKYKPEIYNKIVNIFFEEETFDGDKYISDLRNKIVVSIDKKSTEKKSSDILELMLENMKEIRDYYIISKKQSKKAFALAVFMSIIGFVFLCFSAIYFIFFNYNLLIGLIPTISGVIAEFIAATAFIIYKTSVVQLNKYYDSLHNNERFLSLVNLVSKISKDKQDEAYMNIINVELNNYRNK